MRTLMPGRTVRIMLKVLVPAGLAGSHRIAYRSMTVRAVFIHRYDNLFQKHDAFAVFGCRSDQAGRMVDQSDPCHFDVTVMNDDLADIVEKLLLALAARNGIRTMTANGIEFRETGNLFFASTMFSHIFQRDDEIIRCPVFVTDAPHMDIHQCNIAVFADKCPLDMQFIR